MRILVKVGGAPLLEEAGRLRFARSIQSALNAGHELIVVHGGGEQIRHWCTRLGIEDHYVQGLRVTDEATSEVALAVLAGSVNRSLVHALDRVGAPAVGLTGADGRCFEARPLEISGAQLGYVGEVQAVHPKLPLALCALGYVPVIASMAPLAEDAAGDPSRLYNVNADHAAAPLAAGLEADALLLLSDVEAVRDAEGLPLAELGPVKHAELLKQGALQGGMLPKVAAAASAAKALPNGRVVIASAELEDCVLAALAPGGGTHISAREEVHG
ncbi:MAG: acetylglutamate kinase [Planctomycetota bacterium]|jgi:acetylglutamate kinase